MRIQTPYEPSSAPFRCSNRMQAIRKYMSPGNVGAEIGVFKGSFISHLLETQPSKIYLVDPWYRLSPRWEWAKTNKSTIDAYIKILLEYKPEIESRLIEPRVEFSQEFLSNIPDHHLDWVYIDSSHEYNQTLAELILCLKKVKPTGFIIGDDYYPEPQSQHHGVFKAVNELAAAGKINILSAGTEHQFVASPMA